MKCNPFILFFIFLALMACFSISLSSLHEFTRSDPILIQFKDSLKNEPSIILMGDSVIYWTAPKDADKKPVSKYLEDVIKKPVANLSQAGLGLQAFASMLEFFPKDKKKADVLIIEINPVNMIRNVNQEAYEAWKEKFSFVSEKKISLKKFFESILYLDKKMKTKDSIILKKAESYRPFRNLTQSRYDESQLRDESCVKEIDKLLKQIYKDSKPIAHHIVFFITPLNITNIRMLVDNETWNGLQTRISETRTSLKKLKADVIDLMDDKEFKDHFFDEYQDHLDACGRETLAKKIADWLQMKNLMHAP